MPITGICVGVSLVYYFFLDLFLIAPDGTVKLAGDNHQVLISSGGQWGQICTDQWTVVEADMVCQAMGYSQGFVR